MVASWVIEEDTILVVGDSVEADVDVVVALYESDAIAGVTSDDIVVDEMVIRLV